MTMNKVMLIDANALCEYANNTKDKTVDANDIMRFPTVDAVKVVRCKDCKRYDQINNLDGLCKKFVEFVNPSFFCADGEMDDYCPHCGAKMDGKRREEDESPDES